MGTSPCKKCGTEISETECPSCGDDNPFLSPAPIPSPKPQTPEPEPEPGGTPSPPMS